MLLLKKPTDEVVRQFLTVQKSLPLTYSNVGATAAVPPARYVVDHTRIKLGEGEAVFSAAENALRSWRQFNLDWLQTNSTETPIQTGEVVAVVARAAGLWWLNACKIVYIIDEPGPIRRFGFAYGTLPGHAGTGEERFLIEWNTADDSVHYDILAFSRPNHLLARLGYPLVRRTQKRFGRDSAAAMLRAVAEGRESRGT